MRNARLDEAQAKIKIAGRNINNLRYTDDTLPLWQKTKIMASSPITSSQIDGETVRDLFWGGSKITADGDCSHEIKRCLLLERKAMTNLRQHIKKQRHYFVNKVRFV